MKSTIKIHKSYRELVCETPADRTPAGRRYTRHEAEARLLARLQQIHELYRRNAQ
jgi:hypothetical protein